MACGLSVNELNFESFKTTLLNIGNNSNIIDLKPIISIDQTVDLNDIDTNVVQSLKLLEPFGESNSMPIFAIKNLRINSIRSLTNGKHLKLGLKDNSNNYIDAIGFNLGHYSEEFKIGDKIDIAGNLDINSFNGYDSIQINIKDIIKSL